MSETNTEIKFDSFTRTGVKWVDQERWIPGNVTSNTQLSWCIPGRFHVMNGHHKCEVDGMRQHSLSMFSSYQLPAWIRRRINELTDNSDQGDVCRLYVIRRKVNVYGHILTVADSEYRSQDEEFNKVLADGRLPHKLDTVCGSPRHEKILYAIAQVLVDKDYESTKNMEAFWMSNGRKFIGQ